MGLLYFLFFLKIIQVLKHLTSIFLNMKMKLFHLTNIKSFHCNFT